MSQNVKEGKLMFFDNKVSNLSEIYYLEPGLYPSFTDIVEAMNTLTQQRHNHSESCTKGKMSRINKKKRLILQMKDLLLHFIFWTWDKISETILLFNLECCWEKTDLTNQNLLPTLSDYTLSWYTRTWLNTKSFATQRPRRCVVFVFFFKTQGCRYQNYWTVHELPNF